MQPTTFQRFTAWVYRLFGQDYETESERRGREKCSKMSKFERQEAYKAEGIPSSQQNFEKLLISVSKMTGTIDFVEQSRNNDKLIARDPYNSSDVVRLQNELSQELRWAATAEQGGNHYMAEKFRAQARVIESKLRALGA